MNEVWEHRQTETQRGEERASIVRTIGDHQITLAADGALIIQEIGGGRSVVLSPSTLAELTAFLQQPEVRARGDRRNDAPTETGHTHDPLTGLYHGSAFKPLLERELQQAARQHYPVTMMRLDVDYFRKIAPSCGWLMAERLLYDIGSLLQAHRDAVGVRHDDDGFTLILPGTSLDDATERAEQLRGAIGQLVASYTEYGAMRQITASIGVASFPEHGTSVNALLTAADIALRRAKWEGRNRIAVARSGEQWGPMM